MKPKIKSNATSDREVHVVKAGKKLWKRITTNKNWDDLVIDETARQQLNDISAWIRNVNTSDNNIENKNLHNSYKVLFFGPGGTGKKLAAKLLGKQDNLDIYRVNLSKVVSKYIGETEKNLAIVFDAAEENHAILFFDEADALFGKRTDVSDSHDRYNAPVVSCLLQRLDKHPGLVIFSSKNNNDSNNTFTKHLNAVIHFIKPS